MNLDCISRRDDYRHELKWQEPNLHVLRSLWLLHPAFAFCRVLSAFRFLQPASLPRLFVEERQRADRG